jgi:hypothetical protein
MTECMMDHFGGCCCKCVFLAKVMLNCSQQRDKGYQTPEDGCNCHIQIGWACTMLSRGMNAYDKSHPEITWFGDTKHGICEMFTEIGKENAK